jgi:hypothetical protein
MTEKWHGGSPYGEAFRGMGPTMLLKTTGVNKLVEKIDSTFLTLTDFPSPPRI